MNVIWANRLIAGTKVWAEVPSSRRSGVEAELRRRVESGELTQARYEEIVEGDAA